MKTLHRFSRPATWLVGILATLVMAVVVAPAFAQPNADDPPRRQPAPDFQPGPGLPRRQPGFQGGQMGQLMPLLNRVLTEDQRESLREAAEAQRDQVREQEEKLRAARKEMLNLSLAETFDEAAVRAKALEVGKVEAELTVLRAKALSQMRPPLSPEQIEQLKNPPPPNQGSRPGEFRPEPRRNNRPPPGPRGDHDLPPPPRPDQ